MTDGELRQLAADETFALHVLNLLPLKRRLEAAAAVLARPNRCPGATVRRMIFDDRLSLCRY